MEQDERHSAGQSYHELVTDFQSRLYAFVSVLLAGDEGVADVVQETNVVLWEKASSYDTKSSFAAWGYGIAHYQILAYRKRRGRDSRLMFSDECVSSLATDFQEQENGYSESLLALQGCLSRLSATDRDLIRRRYERAHTVSSLAEFLGRTASSVSTSLYRIRKSLQECVERSLRKDGAV